MRECEEVGVLMLSSVLFIASLLTMAYYVMKHRDAGGNCRPNERQNEIEMNRQVKQNPSTTVARYNRTP